MKEAEKPTCAPCEANVLKRQDAAEKIALALNIR